jgi:hypothetical protein
MIPLGTRIAGIAVRGHGDEVQADASIDLRKSLP